MLSTPSPIPFPITREPAPLSAAALRALDACPSLRRCSASKLTTSSLSPLAAPASPTLIEFFSPAPANHFLPPLTIMGYIARATSPDTTPSPIFWIGRRTFPTPWLLALLNLHTSSLFIDPPDAASTLWTIDPCLRTGGTRIIVADGSHLDMSATRRIQLACESARAHCLLARPDYERAELSAAAMRWHIAPAISDNDLPAWQMTLLRDKRSSLFAGADSPAWTIRTMRISHTQPEEHHENNNIAPCPLHLSSQLVNSAGIAAPRPRRKHFA